MRSSHCVSASGQPKKRWATRAAAEFVAAYMEAVRGYKRYVYECPDCDRWHLSKSPNRRA